MIDNAEAPAARDPSGLELAALLSALRAQRHPAITGFTSDRTALEFLIDACSIVIFDRLLDHEDGDSFSMLLMVMNAGPEYVTSARLDADARITQLAHTTLDDFLPFDAPSRHPSKTTSLSVSRSGPRDPDGEDLRELLRMFASVEEPFMRELDSDAARLSYLRDYTRIAIFDACKSGWHTGRLAFLLWPMVSRFLTVAIRGSGRWRFAGSEIPAD